jgi:hypothetical protein
MGQMIEGNINLLNGIACIFWSGFLLASIYRQKIRYSARGLVVRRESPKLFWLLIAGMGLIAAWTGVTFVLHQT